MVIDIHAHIFPDALAQRAVESLGEKSGLIPLTDGKKSSTEKYMNSCGVDVFAAQNIAVTPKSQKKVNDFAISVNSQKIIAFGSVHPDSSDASEEIERLHVSGIRGIKLHPEYQEFYPDDVRALKIYKKCASLGMAVMFHGGEDLGYSAPFRATPQGFLNAYRAVEYDRFIVAHMGGFNMYTKAVELLAQTKINIDTSFALVRMSVADAKKVIAAFTADRVLFGSDCPWASPPETLNKLNSLGLSKDDLDKILYKNAKKLLGIGQFF